MSMTKAQAIKIRTAQLQGKEVKAIDLQEAIFTLSKKRDRKMTLPILPREVQSKQDATLCFNLGRAIRGVQAA